MAIAPMRLKSRCDDSAKGRTPDGQKSPVRGAAADGKVRLGTEKMVKEETCRKTQCRVLAGVWQGGWTSQPCRAPAQNSAQKPITAAKAASKWAVVVVMTVLPFGCVAEHLRSRWLDFSGRPPLTMC
jgi:hypothetical protein